MLLNARTKMKRFLAEAAAIPLDYTVLSVAVITLGLILVVELIRHRLDVAATGRPFFKTVLEGVYRELATLGCVEFFIFILHKYYTRLNIQQELVFADVHFTLFFTALFNAIQSALLAFCTTRVSTRQWVRTEQLEVDHYVEIREEFERVEALLYGQDEKVRANSRHHTTDGSSSDTSSSLGIEDAEIAFECNCSGISRSCKDLIQFLRYPHLFRKHQQLLVQIRFHELRIHFLQSNKLPLKFKVSDYLKRSELHVLIKLVHISTFAWLMLMGGVALLYYFMGIVLFVTEDMSKVGVAMTGIFIGSQVFFVVTSLLIYNKMKSIFSTIMRKRLTSEVSTGRNVGEHKEITSQQDLFWGGNPMFIRSIIQFMQFGFAISLSILLVFWKDIDAYYAAVPAYGILLSVVLCDAAFVAIIAEVIPRYTLCTSLGQLVNKPRLQDTLAQWQLEEAQRKQRQTKLDPDYDDDESYDFAEQDSGDDASSKNSSVVIGPIEAAKKVISGGLSLIRKSEQKSKTYEDIDFGKLRHAQSEHLTASAGDGSGPLRQTPPEIADSTTMTREARIRERKQRRKAQSVGVALMRNLGQHDAAAAKQDEGKVKDASPKEVAPVSKSRSRERRRKSSSGPEDIKAMRRSSSFETLLLAQLVQTDTKELRKVESDAKTSVMSKEQRMHARRNRKKSTSDGVALMRSVMEADRKDLYLGIPASTVESANAFLPVSHQRRDRRRSVSASESIQQMRDAKLSSEEPPMFTTMTGMPTRLPRSRQSSGGVPRLEPLVEGVAAENPSLNIMPSIEIGNSRENGQLTLSQMPPSSSATVGSAGTVTKGTMDSASTLGDGLSDADDIPEVDRNAPSCVAKAEPRLTFSERVRYYFLSQRYRMISAVFGTVLCFFFVGMRVETFMIASCIMPNYGNTWHIQLSTTFWMETIWLTCFIAVGLYNMFVFRPGHVFSNKERSQFIGEVLDVILCTVCLLLLMLAESRRCCTEGEQRFLAEAYPAGAEASDCEIDYSNCCPSFGSREYGGLGNIEPFTALVGLRLLRFRIAKRVVVFMDRKHAWSDLDVKDHNEPQETQHPFHPFFSKRKISQKEKQKNLETDAAVELWMKVLTQHPDLVDEYGEFSSEILQVMLGIDVACDIGIPRQIESDGSPDKDAEGPTAQDFERLSPPSPPPPPAKMKLLEQEPGETRRTVERKYSHLTPEARAIILSGKLGKHGRSKSAVGADLTSTLKATTVQSPPSPKRKQDLSKIVAPGVVETQFVENEAPPAKVQFDLSPVLEATFMSKETVAAFAAPNARLLRSMRRCDRKLLPLLDKWTIVDVVITKWEIVYFDASDVEGTYGPEYSEEDIKHIENVRQAVVATKGGKGLRLKDVAMGRKVVGHLELSSVDSVHVERIMPTESGVLPEETFSDSINDVQVEFWKSSSKKEGDAKLPREYRWSRVKQDGLRVQSGFGTLLLRFYSDLDESESHPERRTNENETKGPLFKDNAFQWCQTIVRLCGINQLKQKLPHFGDDDDEELRDYLVVVEQKNFQDHPRHMHMRKKSLGNILNSVKDHAQFWSAVAQDDIVVAAGDGPPQGHGRRLSSFGDVSQHRRPSRILRRLSSTGDIPSSRELSSSNLQASAQSKPTTKTEHAKASSGEGPDLV